MGPGSGTGGWRESESYMQPRSTPASRLPTASAGPRQSGLISAGNPVKSDHSCNCNSSRPKVFIGTENCIHIRGCHFAATMQSYAVCVAGLPLSSSRRAIGRRLPAHMQGLKVPKGCDQRCRCLQCSIDLSSEHIHGSPRRHQVP